MTGYALRQLSNVVLVVRALWTLLRLETRIRRTPLPVLCRDHGLSFGGFETRTEPLSPLSRQTVHRAWRVTEAALAVWPWGRDRRCLRGSLLLGSQLTSFDPVLTLEVLGTQPVSFHAVVWVRGRRLDIAQAQATIGAAKDGAA